MPLKRLGLIDRLVAAFTWRDPAARLHAWAQAELGSQRDLLLAANLADNAELVANLLTHAADEARHARMLAARAAELGHTTPLSADQESLYEQLGEVDFLAFVHRGELAGIARFGVATAWLAERDPRSAEVIAALVSDEQGHADWTWRALLARVGDVEARAALARVGSWERQRTMRRAARSAGRAAFGALSTLLFAIAGPVLRLTTRAPWPQSSG